MKLLSMILLAAALGFGQGEGKIETASLTPIETYDLVKAQIDLDKAETNYRAAQEALSKLKTEIAKMRLPQDIPLPDFNVSFNQDFTTVRRSEWTVPGGDHRSPYSSDGHCTWDNIDPFIGTCITPFSIPSPCFAGHVAVGGTYSDRSQGQQDCDVNYSNPAWYGVGESDHPSIAWQGKAPVAYSYPIVETIPDKPTFRPVEKPKTAKRGNTTN